MKRVERASVLKARKRIGLQNALARARVPYKRKDRINPFVLANHPPSVFPKDYKQEMAMDNSIQASLNWAANAINSAFSEGLTFLGYPYLAELTQRPEYRVIAEVIATEMTRKWIRFEAKGEEDKTKKIEQLEEEFKRLDVRSKIKEIIEQDGFFGRSHLYIDLGTSDDREELKSPIGDGWNELSKKKAWHTAKSKGTVQRIKTVEAVWCYPTRYNSSDPLQPDWYRPDNWFVQGKQLHASRLLTFIGREVPDLLKPAYSFGGLSMSQMAKPYIDNWLQTRQSVNDLIRSFSTMVLKTNLAEQLGSDGGDQLFQRVDLFNLCRDNQGCMVVDNDTEDLVNVSASIGGLSDLQAQAQEHMASVSRIPLVKLLGISPTGLNASSEGEIKTFYDWIHAYQEHLLRRNMYKLLGFVMIGIWGEPDPDIDIVFNDLNELNDEQRATIDKTKADTDTIRIGDGIIAPEEARKRLASDINSPYPGLDPDDMPEPPEEEEVEGEEKDDKGMSSKEDKKERPPAKKKKKEKEDA